LIIGQLHGLPVNIGITDEHALMAHQLPFIHKDPFDRLIINQDINALKESTEKEDELLRKSLTAKAKEKI